MKNLMLLALSMLLTVCGVIPASASASTIRDDRTWIYDVVSPLHFTDFGGNTYYTYSNQVSALDIMKFDGTIEVNGKIYHRFALKKVIHYMGYDYCPDRKTLYYTNHFLSEESLDLTMCYLREDNGVVYQLYRDGWMADEYSDEDDSVWTEEIIYNWNLSDGDVWLDNPYIEWLDWRRMPDFDWSKIEDDFRIEEKTPVEISGEMCKFFHFPPSYVSTGGDFIEGVGPLAYGWLGFAYPNMKTSVGSSPYKVYSSHYFSGDYSDLHSLLDGNNDVIYGKEVPDFNETPRLFLYGDMTDWMPSEEWELILDQESSEHGIYKFTCKPGQKIEAGKKFRISNVTEVFKFALPEDNGNVPLDHEIQLAWTVEPNNMIFEEDWKGSLCFDYNNRTVTFSNSNGIEQAGMDSSSDGSSMYDILGRQISSPVRGQLYIQGGMKKVGK